MTEFRRRDGLLTRLYDQGRLDLLQAVKDGRISIQELVHADRQERLGATLVDLNLDRELSGLLDEMLEHIGKGGPETRRRYAVSWRKLVHLRVMWPNGSLRDLAKVDWERWSTCWPGSPSDWNHMRRAVSALLTTALGSEHHPFRLEVVDNIPTLRERERMPDLSPQLFEKLVGLTPPHAQAS